MGRGTVEFAAMARDSACAEPPACDGHYDRFFPYYAEVCALSEIRKKPGSGVDFRSGVGGHSLLYLNGVCRDRRAGYPALKLSEPGAHAASYGVGVSVNSHYRNANWVAAEGRSFVFRGMLGPDERLTRDTYDRTQTFAKEAGILDGVEFHEHLFRGMPPGMSKRDFMYEISVATDYAVTFGRNVYAARVPLDRARMAAIVDFLNTANRPYRDGAVDFRWSIFNNNCCHLTHNALAAAGVWDSWPTGRPAVIAAFNFPVPKNEFVDLMLRTNDMPVHDPAVMYEDNAARRVFFDTDVLPTAPGALAGKQPAIRHNEIYDTHRLRLIFYENPFLGIYRRRFRRIFNDRRYTDLESNLRHFTALYQAASDGYPKARALARERGVAGKPDGGFAQFWARYERYIERVAESTREKLELVRDPMRVDGEVLS